MFTLKSAAREILAYVSLKPKEQAEYFKAAREIAEAQLRAGSWLRGTRKPLRHSLAEGQAVTLVNRALGRATPSDVMGIRQDPLKVSTRVDYRRPKPVSSTSL